MPDWNRIQIDHDNGLSWKELTKRHKISFYLISKAQKEGKFSSRSMKQSCQLAHDSGKHDYQSHRTQEFRRKMSKNGGLKKNAGRCKIIQFRNCDGEEFYLQGGWELALAKHFNSVGIHWIKNNAPFSYVFNLKNRNYYPDFYLKDLDLFVEVKGYETEMDREKWRQFPHKLSVCRKKDIENLERFCNQLPGIR